MIVYLLWSGYEDVDGVFSTREKAEAYRDAHMAEHIYKRVEDYSIIKQIVDEPDHE